MSTILMYSRQEEKHTTAIFSLLFFGCSLLTGCHIMDSEAQTTCQLTAHCPTMQTCVDSQCVAITQGPDLSLPADMTMVTQGDLPADLDQEEADQQEETLDLREDQDVTIDGDMGQDMDTPPVDMGPPVDLPPPGLTYRTSKPLLLVQSVELNGQTYALATNSDPLDLAPPLTLLLQNNTTMQMEQYSYEASRHFAPTSALVTKEGIFLAGYNPGTSRLRVTRLDETLKEQWTYSYRGEEIDSPPVKIVPSPQGNLAVLAMSDRDRDALLLHLLTPMGQSTSTWRVEFETKAQDATSSLVDAIYHKEHIYVLLKSQTSQNKVFTSVLDITTTDSNSIRFITSDDLEPVHMLADESSGQLTVVAHRGGDTVIVDIDLDTKTVQGSQILLKHHTSQIWREKTGKLWSTGSITSPGAEVFEVGYIEGGAFHSLSLTELPTKSHPLLITTTSPPHILMSSKADLLALPIGQGPSAACKVDRRAGAQRITPVQSTLDITLQNLNASASQRIPLNTLNLDLSAEPSRTIDGTPLPLTCSEP